MPELAVLRLYKCFERYPIDRNVARLMLQVLAPIIIKASKNPISSGLWALRVLNAADRVYEHKGFVNAGVGCKYS